MKVRTRGFWRDTTRVRVWVLREVASDNPEKGRVDREYHYMTTDGQFFSSKDLTLTVSKDPSWEQHVLGPSPDVRWTMVERRLRAALAA